MADHRVKAAHDSVVKEGQRLSMEWQTVVQRMHTVWKAWAEGTEANVMRRIEEQELQYDLDTARQAVNKLTNDLNTALQRDHPDIMPGIKAPATSNTADQKRVEVLVKR
ncbi:hypothetical protein ABVK25_000738 [Lepraria finkii]|uniref:Uncharacterized protein n=1 Tax=Lepraria finkii TaxID=1340010 RepID=A0ABR4BP01_9LECA